MSLSRGWQNFISPFKSLHLPLPRVSVEVGHAQLSSGTHGQEQHVGENTFTQLQQVLWAVLQLWALACEGRRNSGLTDL